MEGNPNPLGHRGRSRVRRAPTVTEISWLVAGALTIGVAMLAAPAAVGALVRGALGSSDAITSATLVRATPLLCTGLAVAIAFRAGVFNVGAEGQLLVGAAAATAVGMQVGQWPRALAVASVLLAGAGAGAGLGAIAAVLRTRFHVLEVISTILLNFVALHLVGYLVRGPLQEPMHIYPQSPELPLAARLPALWDGTRLHAGFVIAVLLAMALWWMLRATEWGFRLRATGSGADAARSAGLIDVRAVAARALIVSGAIAGLGGAIEVSGVTRALYDNLSPGYGYTGIAVALLARLNPLAVLASGAVFGALEAGSTAMQRDAGVPSTVVSILEATMILGLVVVWRTPLAQASRGVSWRATDHRGRPEETLVRGDE